MRRINWSGAEKNSHGSPQLTFFVSINPDVGLMDQSCGLQRVAGTFSCKDDESPAGAAPHKTRAIN